VQRLKTRAQFQAVLAGTTVSRTAHFALHRTGLDAQPPLSTKQGPESRRVPSEERVHIQPTGPGSEGPKALFAVQDAWIGALIPKRWAKRAVTRNAIKRQIYAVSSALEPGLPHAAHVVRLRSAFDRAKFPSASSEALKQAVRGELQQLFARATQ
jgi:ribonuclease P protein component